MTRTARVIAATGYALIAVSAAGCHGTTAHRSVAAPGSVASSPTTSTTTNEATRSTASPSPTAGRPVSATTTPGRGGGGPVTCKTSMLAASLTDTQGAAGTQYSHLVLENIAPVPCAIGGYPGVSFVDGHGHQLGAAASRQAGADGLVLLSPGASAAALFALHDAYVGSVDNCGPVAAAGIRIYPPDQTAALFVPGLFTVCANPARAGSASISAMTEPAKLPG